MAYPINVTFILDKSGSMSSVREAAITGFNEYINELKQGGFHYYVTLVLFNNGIEERFTKMPIAQVPALSELTYQPEGGTALYDAVCQTLGGTVNRDQEVAENILRRFKKEDAKPETPAQADQNVVVILTDGEENASRRWRSEDFKALVERREATGRWKFVFLGANQDAWQNAQNWGFAAASVASFNNTEKGLGNAMLRTAQVTNCFSASVMSGGDVNADFFSKEDQTNLKNTK